MAALLARGSNPDYIPGQGTIAADFRRLGFGRPPAPEEDIEETPMMPAMNFNTTPIQQFQNAGLQEVAAQDEDVMQRARQAGLRSQR